MSRAYYNEHDAYAAQWLKNLIAAGLIAPGDVDDRSIEDVTANDLVGYTQCHFFAGIGGWSCALRLAGWPDDEPVWTGSCPCQPFSTSGQGKGFADERHVWPLFHYLIEQSSPKTLFGEQVGSKAGLAWLDLVFDDLEGCGYSCGAFDLAAASIGAPHIRQRLFWVADAEDSYRRGAGIPPDTRWWSSESGRPSIISRLADSYGPLQYERNPPGGKRSIHQQNSEACFWGNIDWLHCRDGKARPVEAGTFPMANGIPGRMGKLRGFGNAIVPQLAAEFIAAYMSVRKMDKGE